MPGTKRGFDFVLITRLRREGICWQKIIDHLKTSRSVISRWRIDIGFVDPLREIDNAELDDIILKFVTDNERRGETMVMGHILDLGINMTRSRIRDSINRVDFANRQSRKNPKIERREYNVRGQITYGT